MGVPSGEREPRRAAGQCLGLGTEWGDTREVGCVVEVAGEGTLRGLDPGAGTEGTGWGGRSPPPHPRHVLSPGAGAGPGGTQTH